MKTFEKLNKNEMKMIFGGTDPIATLEGGCGKDECQKDSDCSGTAGYPHCRTSNCGAGTETVKFCGV